MHSTKVRAYAKVNLTLEIVGRENGFHQLDSLVASVDVFDVIRLKKRKSKLSSIWMHGLCFGYAFAAFGIGALIYSKYNHKFLYYV